MYRPPRVVSLVVVPIISFHPRIFGYFGARWSRWSDGHGRVQAGRVQHVGTNKNRQTHFAIKSFCLDASLYAPQHPQLPQYNLDSRTKYIESVTMKDIALKARPSTSGAHAHLNGSRPAPINGSSKRKTSDNGSLTWPNKKRTVYMDVSDEEDKKSSPKKLNGAMTNGAHASPQRKKAKESANARQAALQEQRRQLPIAQGTLHLDHK